MKRFYVSKLAVLIMLMLGGNYIAQAQQTCYSSPGTYNYTVPAGCAAIQVDLAGAQGGSGQGGPGGKGGRVIAIIAVTPGNVLNVYVGKAGVNNSNSTYNAGGVNGIPTGNADGGQGYYYGGGGGGATDIRTGLAGQLNTRLVVAGGGGGGGYNYSSGMDGGAGGGLTGGEALMNGSTGSAPCQTGNGGTQTGGGSGGTCYGSPNGAPYLANPTSAAGGYATSSIYSSYESGGGGGWYGGGAGLYGGGGGGSSYWNAPGVSLVTNTQGYKTTDGSACITPLLPAVFSTNMVMDFGYHTVGSTSTPFYTEITGQYLQPAAGNITITCPSGYEISSTGQPGSWTTGTITVPYTGATLAATKLFVHFIPGAPTVYNNYVTVSGGGPAIPLNITVLGTGTTTVCAGAPSVGSPTITPSAGGSGTFFTLDLPGVSTATGLFYQWQSASASTGPWTNIPGAVRKSYTFSGMTANTYYRCNVQCGTGSATSSPFVAATFTPGIFAKPCSGIPNPGVGFVRTVTGCSPYLNTFYTVGATQDSAVTHQWQISTDGLSFSNVTGAVGSALNATVNSTIYYRDVVTCKISNQLSYTKTDTAILYVTPDAIAGITPVCTGSAAATIYSSTTPLGKWTSSNIGVATIDSTTGLLTGVGVVTGAATISYTLGTGCYTTANVTVNPSPAAITGTGTLCSKGGTTSLSDVSSGITWSTADGSIASVSGGLVTGVSVGQTSIIVKNTANCTASTTVTVNLQPSAISGASSVCLGAGVPLANVDGPGVWTSSNAFNASVTSGTGFVTGVTAGSTATITYSIIAGGCYVTKNVVVNNLPPAITGNTSVCVSSTTPLSDAATGAWASSLGTTATVNSAGVVSGVAAGSATITFTAAGTGCQVMSNVNVNALPNAFSVTGTGGYCQGTAGTGVGLATSNANVRYVMYKNYPATIIDTVYGSSSALDFGLRDSGNYFVIATDVNTGCARNMSGSATITVNPLPQQYLFYSNALSYCVGTAGVDFKMANADAGVNYAVQYGVSNSVIKSIGGSGSTNMDLGFYKTPGSYRVIATDANGCSNIMNGSPINISVDSLPKAFPVSNNGPAYCAGSAGVDIQLPASASGVQYFLVKNGIPLAGDTILSTGSVVDFGNQTSAGTYVVNALSPANCVSTMTNSVPVTVNALPTPEPVTGGGNFCIGSAGTHVGVAYAFSGTNYSLVRTSSPFDTVARGVGANSSLDFGTINIPGTYTVIGKTGVGCTNTMTGTQKVVANTPPTAGNVIGGGGYCAGSTGSTITLSPVQTGISYRVYMAGTTPTLVATKTGTSGPLSFGPYTATGSYYITGTDPLTGCTTQMNNTALITQNALPVAFKVFAIDGGAYCANDLGKHIFTSGSQPGVKYTILSGGVPVAVVKGTGDSLDMGNFSTPGVYNIVGRDTTTTCIQNLLSTATISINPLPTQYTVIIPGSNSYCAGGTGVHVQLSGSNTGINYQLINNGVNTLGGPLGGVNKSIDFGFQTLGGAYTVIATNTATKCSDTMLGNPSINVIALPAINTVASNSPTYCPGGAGVDVFLTGSSATNKYYLYQGSTIVDSKVGGASPLDFGNRTVGTYTIQAVDNTYGCQSMMSGSPVITYRKVPAAYKVAGTGSYCLTAPAGLPVTLSFSDTGVKYDLYKGAGKLATVYGGRALVNFGNQLSGKYTVIATDTTTTCTNIMTDTATISAITPDTLSVNVSRNKSVVCEHGAAIFTAAPVNGGTIPKYQWLVNHTIVSGATMQNYTYAPTSTSADDTVNVVVTSTLGCVTPNGLFSADAQGYIRATKAFTPTVAITTANTNLCQGSAGSVTFTASADGNEIAPGYKWEKNGKPVGTSAPNYTTSIADSDVVFCVMHSDGACATDTFVYSNPLAMRVRDVITPVITLDVQPAIFVEKGTPVTFTAFVPLAYDTMSLKLYYTYQWYKNDQAISGATGGVYTASDLSNGDNVSVKVTSHDICGIGTSTSNQYMGIGTLGVHSSATAISNVQLMPNPNKGTFTVKGTLSNAANEEVSIEVTNMLGQVVYNNKVMAHDGKIEHQVQLSSSLANGMYLLNFNAGTDRQVFHFVIEN